jgi:aerobic carbon-monoxide dehydrogenase medium subunit
VGSLVHADPAAEMPAVLVLLGGSVEAVSADARRTIPAEQFFAGPMECALRPEELATAASFDRPPAGTRSAFLELSRRHGDYAMCGVAVLVDTAPLGHDPRERMIAGGRAALVGVGAGPVLADLSPAVESGRRFGPDAVRDILDDVIEPEADIHASAEYRRRLAHVLTLRALDEAMSPSGGRQPGTARAPADDDGGPR